MAFDMLELLKSQIWLQILPLKPVGVLSGREFIVMDLIFSTKTGFCLRIKINWTDLGLAAIITEDLWFGARATNLNQPSYGNTDEELPREMATGLSYYLTSEALVTAEIVKDVLFPLSFRSGVQLEVLQSLFIRAGLTTKPETYSFGFGYQSPQWDVNFGLQQHNPLGLSPALDLAVKF